VRLAAGMGHVAGQKRIFDQVDASHFLGPHSIQKQWPCAVCMSWFVLTGPSETGGSIVTSFSR
jgi:hypothetical protein